MNKTLVLLAAVVGVGVGVGALVLMGGDREPTDVPETDAERRAVAAAAFKGEAVPLGGPQAASIDRLFTDLGRAFTAGDAAAIGRHLDVRMLFALLEQQRLVPDEIQRGLRQAMGQVERMIAQRFADDAWSMAWAWHEVRSVVWLQPGSEAVVYVKHKDADGVYSKMRWWIIRAGDRWKVYDYEDLEGGLRLSALIGVAFAAHSRGAPWVEHVPSFMQVAQEFASGDVLAAGARLESLGEVGFPAVIEGARLLMLAGLQIAEERYEDALVSIARAERLDQDMPILHLTRAMALNGTGEYTQAKAAAERYMKALGGDTSAWLELGVAVAGLGDEVAAERHLRAAIKDDDQCPRCVGELARVLPADRKDEVAPHFVALKDQPLYFPDLADALVSHRDPAGLAALLAAFEKTHPEHELVATYRSRLAALRGGGGAAAPAPAADR